MGIGGGRQSVVDHLEGCLAVVIIGVDDSEGGAIDGILGAEHRVSRTPGFDPALGNGEALRQCCKLLIGVADLHGSLLQALADGLHEVLLDGFLDNNDDGIKTGLMGIVNGIVQNGLPLAAHGVDLLQSAVTAAHAGCHDDEYRFLCHVSCLLLFVFACSL